MNDNIKTLIDDYPDEDWLTADGFDDAIIGVYEDKVVYSTTKCIDILTEDMSLEEAVEHFEFNVLGAYVGKKTPIFVEDGMFLT